MPEEGWPEGRAQWWWKYVFPAREKFWLSVLASQMVVADPSPIPWFQLVAADVLEAVVMLRAAASVADPEVAAKLKREAAAKISHAAHQLT